MHTRLCELTLQGVMAIPGVGAQLMAYLPVLERVRLRRVCRAFLSATDESLLSLDQLFGDDIAGATCRPGGQGLPWLLAKCPSLGAISVASRADHERPWRARDSTALSWHLGVFSKLAQGSLSLEDIASRFSGSLRYLNVAGCWDVTGASVATLASRCMWLQALDVSFCGVDDAAICAVAQGCRHLERLSVAKCPAVSDDGIIFLAEACRQLAWLDVGDTRVTAAGITAVVCLRGAGICHLAIDGCVLTDESITAIAQRCPHLAHLGARRCAGENVSMEGMQHLAVGCALLEHLDLAHCAWVGDTIIKAFAESCTLLRHVDLAATAASDAGVLAVARHCHHLEHLDVAGCIGGAITDSSIVLLACGCPRLRHLSLARCRFVTDAGICAVVRACPQLAVLVLTGCGVSDASMLAIARSCPQLVRLDVSACGRQTGKGMADVARCCPLLERVDVSYCEGLTDRSIIEIGERCRELRVLHACGSGGSDYGSAASSFISESSLLPLLKHRGAQLRILRLNSSGSVSDKVVKIIAHHCPRLQELAVAGCVRVSDGSVRTLVKLCRELQYLDVAGCPGVTRESLRLLHRSKFRVDVEDDYDFTGGVEYGYGAWADSEDEDGGSFDGMDEG